MPSPINYWSVATYPRTRLREPYPMPTRTIVVTQDVVSGNPPATPTLSQPVDNGDGTGATASITGSTAGCTNIVQTAPWSGPGTELVWTTSATRVGDGAVSLALSDGFYVARCYSTLGGLPSIVSDEPLFQVSGGATFTSVHAALAAQVQSMIQGMLGTSIIGPTPQSVRVRKTGYLADYSGQNPLPANYAYQLPGIVICYFDVEDIDPALGTNARDEIGYPITIVFAREGQSANTFSEDSDDLFLTWRQAVERTFTNLRGVANNKITVTAGGLNYTFHKCFPRGGLIYDPDRQSKKIDLGWIRFSFRLWRGPLGT